MRDIGIRYYKAGLYTKKQFALFVTRGYVSKEEFKEITGISYEEIMNGTIL